jgi:hypothetical protein
VANHSEIFGHALDQVGSLIKNVGSVTAGVLPGLASGFGSTFGAVNTLLSALKPIAPALGAIGGQALPVIGMFKLFGLATAPLNKLGSKVAGVAGNLGGFTKSLTGSDVAGARVTSTTAKLGSVVGKLGGALPVVGIALGLFSDAMASADQQNQQMQQSLLQGGLVAQKVTNDITKQAEAAASAQNTQAVSTNYLAAQQGLATNADTEHASSTQRFNEAVQKLTADMDPLQGKLATYVAYSDHYGVSSSQATSKLKDLTQAKVADTAAQDKQNLALIHASADMNTLTDAIFTQIGANLGLQGAQLAVTDTDKAYNAAVKQHGKNSQEAKEALNTEEQAYLSVAAAAKIKAKSDDDAAIQNGKNITASQEAADQTKAERNAVLGLVNQYVAAGKTVPVALANIAGQLQHTSGSAIITAAQVDNVSARLRALPPGKSTTVKALTSQAISDLRAVGDKVTHLPNGSFRVSAIDQATPTINRIIANNNGRRITLFVNTQDGAVRSAGTKIAARATGGPVVAGVPYVVGDGGGPEIFVPNQSGRIVGTGQSADILGGSGGGSASALGTGDLYLTLDIGQGITQRIQISNKDLKRGVRAGRGAR